MNSRNTILSAFGFFLIALTLWLHGLAPAGWSHGDLNSVYGGFQLAVGLLLLILAILSTLNGEHPFDALVFFALSTMALIYALPNFSHGGGSMSMGAHALAGWFYLFWGIYFFFLWFGALKTHPTVHMLFLLVAWLTSLSAAIFAFSGAMGFVVLTGYLMLVWGMVSLYIFAGSALHALCGKNCLPMGNKNKA
ncbi:MAG: acetate uptake transporter family protein [Gammaproteobacteria bacterium]